VQRGCSVETTMGFSPTGGLMMGTRSGDLDPGVMLYMLRSERLDAAGLSDLLNRRSGLLGVSGISDDMRDLLDREDRDLRAAAAVDLFCYTARKHLGALCAVLGGLDTLVFTGGIGEHAAPVRARICAGLGFLGIELDPELNAGNATLISDPVERAVARSRRLGRYPPFDAGEDAAKPSKVSVRVIATDEDAVIARHTSELIAGS